MTTKRPLQSLTPLVAAVTLVAAVVACGKPERSPPTTLRSPAAMATAAWCSVFDGDALIAEATENCALSPDRRIAIANRGTSELHLLEIDERNPFLLDTSLDVPGINGFRVGDGPVSVTATSIPGLIAVVSEREASIAFVDAAFQRIVPIDVDGVLLERVALSSAPGHVAAFDDYPVIAWTLSAPSAVETATYSLTCGGGDRLRSDCEPVLTLSRGGRVALDAPAAFVAVHPDGRLWVTLSGLPDISVLGVAGAGLESCSGVPCLVHRSTVAPSCDDGLDNDGDGSVDAADPQCFGPSDDESGLLYDGRTTECGDGLDNDGDGSIDAADGDCRTAAGISESAASAVDNCSNGVDDDLDGAADNDDTSCSSGTVEAERAVEPAVSDALPLCADGEDNDGDGLIDEVDPNCYGAATQSESATALSTAGAVVVFPEGDYVAVVDVTTPQLIVYDAETYARIDVNGADRLRTGYGIFIPSRLPTVAAVDSLVVLDGLLAGGERILVTDRLVHVATTGGIAYTFDIDRTFVITGVDGAEIQREVEVLMRRRDASASSAEVRGLGCALPNSIFAALDVQGIGCGDERLPSLAIVDENEINPDVTNWLSQPGLALVGLPQRTAWTPTEDLDAIEAVDVTNEYRVAGDNFEVIFEGVLPASERDDVVFAEPGVLRALGAEPCDAVSDVCSAGLSINDCPELVALCEDGVDVCAADMDVCALCPSACAGAVDFCAAGVVAGDTVVLETPRFAPDANGACDGVAGGDSTSVRWEYEVLAVTPDALTIAPLTVDDPRIEPAAATFVPEGDCWGRPFSVEVRAHDSWVLNGTRSFGHPSARIGVDGVCELRDDAPVRNGRPREGERFTSEYGMQFEIVAGSEPAFRDYGIEFIVASGFANREARSRQFLLGPGTSAIVVTDSQRGRRVVFADEAQDYVWVYSATTFQTAARPVP
jgi:hypothetical protein